MITISWHASKEKSWENDWIEFLFSNIPHKTITDYQQSQYIDNSYIVFNAGVDIAPFVNTMSKNGKKFGLIHLSDEWDKDSTDVYSMAHVVLRNYYKDLGDKVINFPLGWMNTFPYDLPTKILFDRQYVWSFSGHVDKTTRPLMAKSMSTVPKGKSYFKKCGENWGPFDGHALNPQELANMYNDSIFVPCPQGNCSIDSFRVTEALQVGALPIVERSDYWDNLFGSDNPLIQIDNWAQAPKTISELLSDPWKLEQQRSDTYIWWLKYCDKLKNKLTGLL